MKLKEMLTGTPMLIDGAWGSQLLARGLPTGACPDAWNLTHAGNVEDVARAYVEVGSQIILTNTFGASRLMLDRHDLASETAAINRAGVEISRRAATGGVRVFASMGPTGRMLAMGDVTEAELREAFAEQACALAEAVADAIVVETMSDLMEARIAVEAAAATGLPVVGCMTYGAGRGGERTMMGVKPEQQAEALAEAGAQAIGSNCGLGPDGMLPILRTLKAASDLPIWIKPNAGLPQQVGDRAVYVYNVTPEAFAAQAVALVHEGAAMIGGCCGTGPAFITALHAALGSTK